MTAGFFIRSDLVIPFEEIEFSTSRSSGAGGQHVNKTESRVTLRWNLTTSLALNDQQRALLQKNLNSLLSDDGTIILHNSTSRSQHENKEIVLDLFKKTVLKGLFIPKKRFKTKPTKSSMLVRLESKKRRGVIKKMRQQKIEM